MAKERLVNKNQELEEDLKGDVECVRSLFKAYYQETDFLDEVARGIVLNIGNHGALGSNLNLLVPEEILTKVMETVYPVENDMPETGRYLAIKNNFDTLFDGTTKNLPDGFTREMYAAWKDNVDKLVVTCMDGVATEVTNREMDGGINYREAANSVFTQLLDVDSEVDYSGKSIVTEVSNNLSDSTTSATFLSVLSWMKETPGLGYQIQLTGGIWWITKILRGDVANELSIDQETMDKIVGKVRKNPGVLVEIAPAIGKVITTYQTHGAKSAMLYLLQVGEWAQQDIDGTMELPWSLVRQDFYEYFEDKVMNYRSNGREVELEKPISETVFNKSSFLKKAVKGRKSDIETSRILSEDRCVLPGFVYQKIFDEPSVVMKLIPCLERTFGHGEGKVAAAVLYVADLGQRSKLQGKIEKKQGD